MRTFRWSRIGGRSALLLATAVASGCHIGDIGCVLLGYFAIAVHVRDQRTGALIDTPIVTATRLGTPPGQAQVTIFDGTVQVEGGPGVYDLTVRKEGYADLTRRVTVDAEDSRCGVPRKVELDLALARTP